MIFKKATFRVLCVGLIALSTWLVAYSGWRSRILNPDLILPANAAIEFEQDGKIPERSCLSSTCGYNPPGTSWLLLPGIIMFRDARLFEAPGTLVLHTIAIAGLVVIGTTLGSSEVGILAAFFYSVGPRGLFFASSLWPRSHPAFCVWTLAFLLLYLKSQRGYYFGLAILTFGLGLLVFLEMAPLGIAFPLAVMFRPRGRRLAAYSIAAVILVIAAWMPYLRFEGTRNYDDLQRLLARGTCPIVEVSSYNWCSTSRTPVYVTVSNRLVTSTVSSTEPSSSRFTLRSLISRLVGNVTPSFAVNWRDAEAGTGFPFATSLRSLLFVFGLVAIFGRCSPKLKVHFKWFATPILLLFGGLVSLLIGGFLNPRFIGLFTRSGTYYDLIVVYSHEALWLGVMLFAAGSVLVIRHWKEDPDPSPGNSTGYELLIAAYAVSWMFWALIGGDYRYFFWLWPMQALFMAFGVGLCLAIFFGTDRCFPRNCVLIAAVVGLIAANGSFGGRLSGWAKESWSGKDDPVVASLDQIANERNPESARTIRIIYEIAVREYIPIVGALDRAYLPGMEYNLYLRQKYGIENEVQCIGVPNPLPDYLIRDENRRSKTGIGEFVWFDVDSELTKSMNIVSRRGSITLLARRDPADDNQVR